MPNCFQLTHKGDTEPMSLNKIDEMICNHLNVPVDEVKYVHGWFDSIGFSLACGRNWEQVRENFSDCPELMPIIDFLEENFTSDSWAEIGRR